MNKVNLVALIAGIGILGGFGAFKYFEYSKEQENQRIALEIEQEEQERARKEKQDLELKLTKLDYEVVGDKIYHRKEQKVTDNSLYEKARNDFWEKKDSFPPKFKTAIRMNINPFTERLFFKRVSHELDMEKLNSIFEYSLQQILKIGFEIDKPKIIPVRKLEDLFEENNSGPIVFITENLTDELKGRVQLYDETGKELTNNKLEFSLDMEKRGEFSNCIKILDKGKITFEKQNRIILKVHGQSDYEVYSAIFSELMHYSTQEYFCNALKVFSMEENSGDKRESLAIANKKGSVLEENVVHGIVMYMLMRDSSKLGINKEDLEKDIAFKKTQYNYMGVIEIANWCGNEGGERVLELYRREPKKVFERLVEKIKRYGEIKDIL